MLKAPSAEGAFFTAANWLAMDSLSAGPGRSPGRLVMLAGDSGIGNPEISRVGDLQAVADLAVGLHHQGNGLLKD